MLIPGLVIILAAKANEVNEKMGAPKPRLLESVWMGPDKATSLIDSPHPRQIRDFFFNIKIMLYIEDISFHFTPT